MESDRRSDNHRIEVGAIEEVLKPARGGDFRMQPAHMRQPLLARIANEFELAVGGLPQVTD